MEQGNENYRGQLENLFIVEVKLKALDILVYL